MLTHDGDGTGRMAHYTFGDTAHQDMLQPAVAVRRNDNEVCLLLPRNSGDYVERSTDAGHRAHGHIALAGRRLTQATERLFNLRTPLQIWITQIAGKVHQSINGISVD